MEDLGLQVNLALKAGRNVVEIWNWFSPLERSWFQKRTEIIGASSEPEMFLLS